METLAALEPQVLALHAVTVIAKLEDSDLRVRNAAVETAAKLLVVASLLPNCSWRKPHYERPNSG